MTPPEQVEKPASLKDETVTSEDKRELPGTNGQPNTAQVESTEIEPEENTTATIGKFQDAGEKEKKPRLSQAQIKQQDEYYQCPLCDYVNLHDYDIGGHHFKKGDKPHPDEQWDISSVRKFERPVGGGDHIEFRRKMPNKGGRKQWIPVNFNDNSDTSDIIEDIDIDEQDRQKLDLNAQYASHSSKRNLALSSAPSCREHLKRSFASNAKRYAGMDLSEESPSQQPKKRKSHSMSSIANNNIKNGSKDDQSTVRGKAPALILMKPNTAMSDTPGDISTGCRPAYRRGVQDGIMIGRKQERLENMFVEDSKANVTQSPLLTTTPLKPRITHLEKALNQANSKLVANAQAPGRSPGGERIDDEYDAWDVATYGADPASSLTLLQGAIELAQANINKGAVTRWQWSYARTIFRAYYRGHWGDETVAAINRMQPLVDMLHVNIDLARDSLGTVDAILAVGQANAED